MATRRISKKKAVVEEAPPVARQVVEEVVEETPADVLEDIKKDAKDIENAAEQLEETLQPEAKEKPVKEEAPQVVDEPEAVVETKEQAVVSELYKPHPAEIPTEVIAESSSSIRSLVIWSLVVIGIALLTGGILLVAVKGAGGGVSIGAKPTPTPTQAPTPTPAQTVSRADLSVGVLNGGGVVGSGAKMKTLLEEKGYTVGEVKNAEEFTFEETQIHVKADKAGALDLLKADLSDKYSIGTSGADLSSTSSFDAQVIVGKK